MFQKVQTVNIIYLQKCILCIHVHNNLQSPDYKQMFTRTNLKICNQKTTQEQNEETLNNVQEDNCRWSKVQLNK